MAMALAAGILVAIILFLVGLSLETLRRFSKRNNSPESVELREAPEIHPIR